MDFKNATAAVFVGEEPAGKPNHFGEVKKLTMPSSGLQVLYSSKYFQRDKNSNKGLIPDYKCAPSFNDFMKGNDPAMNAIRKGTI
jgi:hypothetical protein